MSDHDTSLFEHTDLSIDLSKCPIDTLLNLIPTGLPKSFSFETIRLIDTLINLSPGVPNTLELYREFNKVRHKTQTEKGLPLTNYPARSFVLVYKITEAYRGRRISRSKLEEVFKLKGDLPKKRPNLQSTAADSELLLDQSELDLTLGLDISHIPIADEGQYLERESTTEDQTETSPGSPHHPEGHQEGPPGTGHHDVPDDVSSSRTQGPSAVDPPSVVGTLNPNRELSKQPHSSAGRGNHQSDPTGRPTSGGVPPQQPSMTDFNDPAFTQATPDDVPHHQGIALQPPIGAPATIGKAKLIVKSDIYDQAEKLGLAITGQLSKFLLTQQLLEQMSLDFDSPAGDGDHSRDYTVRTAQQYQSEMVNELKSITSKVEEFQRYKRAPSREPLQDWIHAATKKGRILQANVAEYLRQRKIPVQGNTVSNETINDLSTTLSNTTLGANPLPQNSFAKVKIAHRKLPEVNLQKFDGTTLGYLQWKLDFDQYITDLLVHNSIDYFQANTYLRGSMPDHYKKLFANLPYNKDGFDQIFQELQQRHGDQKLQNLVWRQKLKKLPICKSSLQSLQHFRVSLKFCLDGLQLAGITAQQEGDQWFSTVLPKLTPDLLTEWHTWERIQRPNAAYTARPDITNLVNFLAEKEIEVRGDNELAKLSEGTIHHCPPEKPYKRKATSYTMTAHHETNMAYKAKTTKKERPSTSKSPSTTPERSPPPSGSKPKVAKAASPPRSPNNEHFVCTPTSCCFCGSKDHKPADCRNPSHGGQKMWPQLYSCGLCHTCLNAGHRANHCPYRKQCGIKDANGEACPQFHHRRLHKAPFLRSDLWRRQQEDARKKKGYQK